MTKSDKEEHAGEESPTASTGIKICVNQANNLEKRKSSIKSTKKMAVSTRTIKVRIPNSSQPSDCTREHHRCCIGTRLWCDGRAIPRFLGGEGKDEQRVQSTQRGRRIECKTAEWADRIGAQR